MLPTRRDLLARTGMGLGTLGLAGVLADAGLVTAAPADPLAPKPPPGPAKAKRLIHVFLNGGPSQVDTFDPKPMLARYAGRPLPGPAPATERKTGAALPSPFKFARHGQSGLEVSELFPKLAAHADDLCVVRSMQADIPNHEPCFMLMNCGDAVMSRPSVGAWLTYGLGTENKNLPGFVVLSPGGYPTKETENWRSGFLPPVYQGTFVDPTHKDVAKLIPHVKSPHATPAAQRRQLDLLRELAAGPGRPADPRLDARVESFELAYRMQAEAADAFDVGREPKAVRDLYGDTVHGRQCLIARRLVERGVRVVQVWHGASQPWDAHEDVRGNHKKLAGEFDGPIAALLADLKRTGLLADTLVLIGGEFGRTPVAELVPGKRPTGRDHNPYGFSVVLAGGGVKGGQAVGATDEFGYKAVENKVHVHDLHATMLHLLGFDHERFTYRYAGRDFRLTDVHGRVVKEVLA